MKRTALLQEVGKMRFEEAYEGCKKKAIDAERSGKAAWVCERIFQRY